MIENSKFAEGGCTCGGIRYRITSKPLYVHCCHCTWCQRESGSAFAINALIEASNVNIIKGAPERIAVPSLSEQGQLFIRCPTCRIALWSHYSGLGENLSFLRVGTMDDPALSPPDIHIFTSTKQPWVTIPVAANVVENYYKRSDFWPNESLSRFKALREYSDDAG